MYSGQLGMTALLLGLIGIAVVSDVRRHRIPNLLILLGLSLGLVGQVHAHGWVGLGDGVLGMLVGFAVFLPFYAAGGMAAGDVKLMAVAGVFLAPAGALWAAACSLLAGGLIGAIWVVVHGQVSETAQRYWLIARTCTYIPPARDEIAGKPFPYATAIFLGVLTSLFWAPINR